MSAPTASRTIVKPSINAPTEPILLPSTATGHGMGLLTGAV